MTTDRFSRQQFETVLATINRDFIPLGIVKSEYCYVLPITGDDAAGIYIRSSVDFTGYAASTGEDSIRLYMVERGPCPDHDMHTRDIVCKMCANTNQVWDVRFGSKPDSYTTRVPGWEKRLLAKIDMLRTLQERAGFCPTCNRRKRIFLSHTTANPNRWFAKCTLPLCRSKGAFAWL